MTRNHKEDKKASTRHRETNYNEKFKPFKKALYYIQRRWDRKYPTRLADKCSSRLDPRANVRFNSIRQTFRVRAKPQLCYLRWTKRFFACLLIGTYLREGSTDVCGRRFEMGLIKSPQLRVWRITDHEPFFNKGFDYT